MAARNLDQGWAQPLNPVFSHNTLEPTTLMLEKKQSCNSNIPPGEPLALGIQGKLRTQDSLLSPLSLVIAFSSCHSLLSDFQPVANSPTRPRSQHPILEPFAGPTSVWGEFNLSLPLGPLISSI